MANIKQFVMNYFFTFENFLISYNIEGDVHVEKYLCKFLQNDYIPDLCYFPPEDYATFKEDQSVFPIPPFIVEVLSPQTEKVDRNIKLFDYQDHNVKEIWLIDPNKKEVEQYSLIKNKYIKQIHAVTDTIHCFIFKGLNISVETIFKK